MELSIGTPPQSFPILPDSGADDLAILSTFLPADEQGNEALYNTSKSTTVHELSGYTYSICYGSGIVIWGDTFIDAQFVVFDYCNGQVGFANKTTTSAPRPLTA